MRNFKLVTKISGETVTKCNAWSYDEAVENFSIRKNLPVNDLMNIYDVI